MNKKGKKKMKNIYFDMDGTIADLYGVENWLEYLKNENPAPYRAAAPMLDMENFSTILEKLQGKGYTIGIISWLAKNSSEKFNEKITFEKISWLNKYLPNISWNEIHIVEYGTNKSFFGCGILFDDEIGNRKNWAIAEYDNLAFDEKDILRILENFL